ncbi:MAG: hypothetical protein DID90_2727554031 [Candidatus Nitrotoga sp. LAW]|nr:MAG: hypothetical protein DID90_2727554031 [Candidatus Nitrotoga sp. LAW]
MRRFPARRCQSFVIHIVYTRALPKAAVSENSNAHPTILNLVSLDQMTAITANGRYLFKHDGLYERECHAPQKELCPFFKKHALAHPYQ